MTAPRKTFETPEQIEAIVRSFDPECVRNGRELQFLNPHRSDRKRGSASINLDTGAWADFADTTGKAKGKSAASLQRFMEGINTTVAGKQMLVIPKNPLAVQTPAPLQAMVPLPAAPKGTPGPTAAPPKGFKYVGSWGYVNEAGLEFYYVARYDALAGKGKTFRPFHWEGKWILGDPPGKLPLYHLNRLRDRPDAPVLLCEGEKKTDAAQKRFPDYVCTTSPHGANSAAKADWSPLAGRLVVVWPDNDEPGRGYAEDAAKLLHAAGGATVRIVQIPPHFPEKWDLADEPPKATDLESLLSAAVMVPPTPQPLEMHDPTSWATSDAPPVRWLVKGLLPQGVPAIFAGKSNGGKSLIALHLSLSVASGLPFFGYESDGVAKKVLYLSMEDDQDELRRRFRRCLEYFRESKFWTEKEEAKLLSNWRPVFPNWASDEKKTLGAIAGHLQRFADELCSTGGQLGLIVLDTLAALSEGDENDANVQSALWASCHRLVEGTGASSLMIHHVRKQAANSKLSMAERLNFDNLRGSSAIVAGTRAIIQLEPLSPEESVKHGLDEDRAAAGNYVILAMTKQISGVKGGWVALQQRAVDEVGAGFFELMADSENICASLRSKAAAAKLSQAQSILLDLSDGVPLEDIALKHWPKYIAQSDRTKKLQKALSDIRRRQKWLEPGSTKITLLGQVALSKLREKSIRQVETHAVVECEESSKSGPLTTIGKPTKVPTKTIRQKKGTPLAAPSGTGKKKRRLAEKLSQNATNKVLGNK